MCIKLTIMHLTKQISSGNVIMALEIRAACIFREVVNLIFQKLNKFLADSSFEDALKTGKMLF